MTARRYPLPGMREAIAAGCPCENQHGALRFIAACPIHGVVTHPSDNGAGVREASPVRIGGDAWGCP